METEKLLELYHSHRGHCCKCGCYLESELDLDGNFYCINCDNIFDDMDERIFEPDEEDEDDE